MSTNYIIYNGQLYHHGVKGMKWGVRRDRIISTVSQKIKKDVEKSKSKTISHRVIRSVSDVENRPKSVRNDRAKGMKFCRQKVKLRSPRF